MQLYPVHRRPSNRQRCSHEQQAFTAFHRLRFIRSVCRRVRRDRHTAGHHSAPWHHCRSGWVAGGAICGRSGSLRTGHGAVASALRAAQGAGGFVADLQPVQLTVGLGTQLRCADGAACTFCTAASGIFFGGFCFGLVALPSGSRRARHLNGVSRHHIGAGAGRTLVNLDRSYSVLRGVILFQRRSKSGGRSRALGYASA
ncbi:hypothetical protein SPWS13_0658 [Shewanella putrefaciens]|nr:hypothetical protein SPWS13_0658 [Shewanella putrefaciens]